ncbi:Ser/Thr phosphatase family protein [Clostridiales bacterium oral taxon 876 str. F0540]|nr:Ser/Thr phosphatase family protein [Clostridiales bacterium oral taxon 876 str. F0540]
MRFMILSDTKGKYNGINEKVISKLLKESKKLKPEPEFIVLGGDNIAGSSDKAILVDQLEGFRKLIEKYYPHKPLLPIIGNHEVNNEPTDDSYEKVFQIFYSDMLPGTCLENYNNTSYYVDYGDTRLIILNSFHYGELNKVSEKQLAFLEDAASKETKNKFVFIHSPAFPTGAHFGHCLDLYPSDRDSFWNVVKKHNIHIVFSGHEHNYSIRKIDSAYQIITGGGGEKLRDKYKDKKGVLVAPIAKHHFVIVDVDEDFINISAIGMDGKILNKFKIEK